MDKHKKLITGLFGFGVEGERLCRILKQTPSFSAIMKKPYIKNEGKNGMHRQSILIILPIGEPLTLKIFNNNNHQTI
jgi:hypothetical protein